MRIGDVDRQVIPRWTLFETGCKIGEVSFSAKRDLVLDGIREELEEKEHIWASNQSLPLATELVSIAHLLGENPSSTVADAARHILKSVAEGDVRREIARSVLESPDLSQESSEFVAPEQMVRKLRLRLRAFPKDPATWLDLAYFFTLLGNDRNASRAVNAALSIAGNDPFVLRSTSRFFVHRNEPDQALWVLNRATTTAQNPRLLSASIAIAEAFGFRTRGIRYADRLFASGNHSPSQLSELHAAISALEFRSGSSKKAKRSLQQSLANPTENALAQAVWLLQQGLHCDFHVRDFQIPFNFEAAARESYVYDRFLDVFNHCKAWQSFQQLSGLPARIGSYVACVFLEDYEGAIAICNQAFPSSSNDLLLHNNKAVALANLGRISEAQASLEKAVRCSESVENQGILLATQGLIEFRSGNTLEGRRLYRSTFDKVAKLKDPERIGLLCLNWIREEVRSGSLTRNYSTGKLKPSSGKEIREFSKASELLLSLPTSVGS